MHIALVIVFANFIQLGQNIFSHSNSSGRALREFPGEGKIWKGEYPRAGKTPRQGRPPGGEDPREGKTRAGEYPHQAGEDSVRILRKLKESKKFFRVKTITYRYRDYSIPCKVFSVFMGYSFRIMHSPLEGSQLWHSLNGSTTLHNTSLV